MSKHHLALLFAAVASMATSAPRTFESPALVSPPFQLSIDSPSMSQHIRIVANDEALASAHGSFLNVSMNVGGTGDEKPRECDSSVRLSVIPDDTTREIVEQQVTIGSSSQWHPLEWQNPFGGCNNQGCEVGATIELVLLEPSCVPSITVDWRAHVLVDNDDPPLDAELSVELD